MISNISKSLNRLKIYALAELNEEVNRSKRQNVVAICFDKQLKIICIGNNSFYKTCTKQALFAKQANQDERKFLHAEIDAILRWRRFSESTPYGIFIARLNKHGAIALSAPCLICQIAIKNAGIKKIYHT